MVTYSSYLKKKTDLGGTGLVVGFANSSFELLAGIGVFAALGFMAQAGGKAVNEVASGGIGLAFIAFPTIINQAPMGWLIGILFFGSLVFAGVTDPEKKRKIIGAEFIEVFDAEEKKLTNAKWLAQGTIYPDVIESAGAKTKKAHAIKSHHNVGGLPENMKLKLLEPLRDLFKDE
ncbi:hypothetical protein MM710_32505, partial [Klebsiella pneumoniae]|nr:hypothetical protein [Klebsiella pneumoniae]